MQGMVPGQMYPQQPMYVVADGTAAAGPIGVSSHPELYSKMMSVQQQPGFQAYANFPLQALPQTVPPTMLAPVPLSPERRVPMQVGPASPATAVFNSPSNENFNRGGRGAQEWNHKGVKWWGEMTFDHKQWVEGQFNNARPTGYQGIRQDGKWLLCREECGAIHLLDHQVWSEQGAVNFFASLMQGASGADVAPDATGRPTTYEDVFEQGKDAQSGGHQQDQQADGGPVQGDDSRKKDKKKKKSKDKKGDAKGEDKGHGKGGKNDPAGGTQDKGQGKGGSNADDGGDGKNWVYKKKEQSPADGSWKKQDWKSGWSDRKWKEYGAKKEPTAAEATAAAQTASQKPMPKIIWKYLGIFSV